MSFGHMGMPPQMGGYGMPQQYGGYGGGMPQMGGYGGGMPQQYGGYGGQQGYPTMQPLGGGAYAPQIPCPPPIMPVAPPPSLQACLTPQVFYPTANYNYGGGGYGY